MLQVKLDKKLDEPMIKNVYLVANIVQEKILIKNLPKKVVTSPSSPFV